MILEDLPEEFGDALNEYNQRVNEIFHQYLITVANQVTQQKGRERKLPLSSIGETWELCFISGLFRFRLLLSSCQFNPSFHHHNENENDSHSHDENENENDIEVDNLLIFEFKEILSGTFFS